MSAMWRRVLPSVPVYQIAERITDYSCDQQGGDGLLRGKITYLLSCLRALLVEIARRFAGGGRYTLDKLACSVHRLPAGLGGAVGCVLGNGFSLVDQGSSLCPSPPTGFVRPLGCLPTGVFRNLLRPFVSIFSSDAECSRSEQRHGHGGSSKRERLVCSRCGRRV